MLNFHRLKASVILGIILPISLHGQAGRLEFAWPDGASAKVQVRSEGKQVSLGKTDLGHVLRFHNAPETKQRPHCGVA